MGFLLSHWVGLWIASGKMVIDFNCFQLTCFIFWLSFLVMFHPSCCRVKQHRNLTTFNFASLDPMLNCTLML